MADLRAALHAALDQTDVDALVTVQHVEDFLDQMTPALAGWVYEHDRVPQDLAGMSATERGVWLSVERVYNACLRAEGIDRNPRSRTPFRDLVPDAQQAVILTLVPVIQMLHGVALNPEARCG